MAITVNPRAIHLREPNLLIPGRKPVGPVRVDWSHPLARGLRFLVVPSSASRFTDLVSGLSPTLVSTTISWVYGVPLFTDGYLEYPFISKMGGFSRITVAVLCEPAPGGGSVYVGALNGESGSSFNSLEMDALGTEWANGRPRIRSELGVAGAQVVASYQPATAVGYSKPLMIGTKYDGAYTYALMNKESNSTAASGALSANTEYAFFINLLYNSGSAGYGIYHLVAEWDRDLSAQEWALFVDDPYAFLIPA